MNYGDSQTEPTYSIADAARLAARNPQDIRKWIREGRLEATKIMHAQGQPYRISAAALGRVVSIPRRNVDPAKRVGMRHRNDDGILT
jgi:hypothetical protein